MTHTGTVLCALSKQPIGKFLAQQMIHAQGYPDEASERAAIVAWLRSEAKHRRNTTIHGNDTLDFIANDIERGEHLK